MHECTGQIGPLKGFPKEELKHVVELTEDERRVAQQLNRGERRKFARILKNKKQREFRHAKYHSGDTLAPGLKKSSQVETINSL